MRRRELNIGQLRQNRTRRASDLMKRQDCVSSPSARIGALLVLGAALAPVAPALAGGSIEAGQAKSTVCAACHGVDGNSLNPIWPSIAGQNEAYIVRSLRDFKAGTRKNVLMTAQAAALSEEDIQDLAAYFASRTLRPKTADPDLVAMGEQLYRGGNKETGIGACIACHGPAGSGNGPAGYPAIAGQHAPYTVAQLMAYRSGERVSDPSQMMRNNTARMTDAEIEAVASYVQGLREAASTGVQDQ
jgi:cytochrome c553